LNELLSLPSSAADLNLSPQLKREKLFEVFLNQLEAETLHHSVLMVFEDVHWIDPTSHELLDLIVDQVRRLPVLLVITFRPEFLPPWVGRSHVMSLMLNRLSERDGETLVHELIGNAGITAEIVAEIVERTDGVPLFVEELTKAVLESAAQGDRVVAVLGTASQTALSVPATLHASLMARLDRLGPSAKEVTGAQRRHWKRISLNSLSASPSCWRITIPRQTTRRRLSRTGIEPARPQCKPSQTSKRLSSFTEDCGW
jgi:predicted ATPase